MVAFTLEDRVVAQAYGRAGYNFCNKNTEVQAFIRIIPTLLAYFQLRNGSERRELLRQQALLVGALGNYPREIRTSKDHVRDSINPKHFVRRKVLSVFLHSYFPEICPFKS
ncbi:hypothetical protein V8B97DRAFT_1949154 [Scleroderma yunnanense]